MDLRPFFASTFFLLIAACGTEADPSNENGEGGPGSENRPPGSNPGETPPAPPERREFPMATPSIGGFALAPAFPSAKVTIPSALVWPKVAGAKPFVLERTGTLLELGESGTRKLLDISASVALVSESGALGFALHPEFGDGSGAKPYGYLWYNTPGSPNNKQRLSRFTWSAASKTFDRASEKILVEEVEQRPEHNAGRVAFGPDGFLYFGNGDDSDKRNHQRLDRALFAGIFRIDVDERGGNVSHAPPRQPEGGFSSGYFIPNDNPFVGTPNALEEFYALGLRNPFGFSFDRQTGALWTGDVGDTWREEINVVVKGGNYGWPYLEAELVRFPTPLTIGTVQAPKYAYSHAEMGDLAAILGGYVYRGKALPELSGQYIYSDWPSGRVWALDGTTPKTIVDNAAQRVPMAFAEDNDGEVYVLHFDGIAKLVRASDTTPKMPRRLVDTTLFANLEDLAALKFDKSFVPYEIASPLWTDGAAKRRFISVPPGKKVELDEKGALVIPKGTRFVKHFELGQRRMETRVLVVGEETTWGVSYRWNAKNTDGDLVPDPVDEAVDDGGKKKSWHYPSLGQCWQCHRSETRVLGFTASQILNRDALVASGVFDAATIAKLPQALVKPSDATAPLDARASAWLAANCSSCHRPGASFLGGGDTWNALAGVPIADRGLIGMPHHNDPVAGGLGVPSAPLVDPGNPQNSLLLARIKSDKRDLQMPPLGRSVIDPDGAALIEQWIASLPK